MDNTTSFLASLATLKCLNDSGKYKSPYQLLSVFIKNVINIEKMYSFDTLTIKTKLKEHFGFDIPEAVISTSLKKIPEVSLDRNEYHYQVKDYESNELTFIDCDQERNTQSANGIVEKMNSFIGSHINNQKINNEKLTKEFIAYIIGDESFPCKYSELISQFIIENSEDMLFKNQLDLIREGSLLYIGINSNIPETGSITNELTLFFSTEILFGLAGYNGEIYRSQAEELMDLIEHANKKTKRIKVKYFEYIKKEIDDFFLKAEYIVTGQERIWDNSSAMNAIINGCKTKSDISERQADFYYNLEKKYGIKLDCYDYYLQDLDEYNLECIDSDDDEKTINAKKAISNINKLRHGRCNQDILDSKFLIVSNSTVINNISKKEKEQRNCCDYSVYAQTITNLLWYKLGGSFGGAKIPLSFDVVIQAQKVLSSFITKNVSEEYKKIKEELKNGKITEDQVAARIMVLQQKPTFPEEITAENIDDSLDFSLESISRYETQLNNQKRENQEANAIIQSYKKRDELRNKEETNNSRMNQIEEKLKKQKKYIKQKNTILISVIILMIVIGVVLFCFEMDISGMISFVLGGLITILNIIKKDFVFSPSNIYDSIAKKFFKIENIPASELEALQMEREALISENNTIQDDLSNLDRILVGNSI